MFAGVNDALRLGRIRAVPQAWTSWLTAERCAVGACAIGVLMFGASAVQDFVCLRPRSAGQPCGALSAAFFYVGTGVAVLLLIVSAVLRYRAAREARSKVTE